MATLFDIPATYFFSFTTVLLEEAIFRGFIFSALFKRGNMFIPILLSSVLWTLNSYTNFFQNLDVSFKSILFGSLNLISLGFACSALFVFSRSIWPGYSYRISLMVFSTALLGGSQTESNSFFGTNSSIFSSGGIFIILLNFIFALLLIKLHKKRQKPDILKIKRSH